MSYYRRLPTDVRVAMWLEKPHVRQWVARVLCALPVIVALAWLARSWGLK